jgi:hypothetical protein
VPVQQRPLPLAQRLVGRDAGAGASRRSGHTRPRRGMRLAAGPAGGSAAAGGLGGHKHELWGGPPTSMLPWQMQLALQDGARRGKQALSGSPGPDAMPCPALCTLGGRPQHAQVQSCTSAEPDIDSAWLPPCRGAAQAVPLKPWHLVPGTSFVVDRFNSLPPGLPNKHWFLTHFHADHYKGLTSK